MSGTRGRPGIVAVAAVACVLLMLPGPSRTSLSAQELAERPPATDTASVPIPEALRGTAQLAGRVVAAETDEPLPQALVVLPEAGIGTLTDSTGFFALVELDPGRWTVEVRYLGRRSPGVEAELVAGELTVLDLSLTVAAVELEELEVTVNARERRRGKLAPFYERMEYGMGQFITREEIAKRSGQRLSEVFRSINGYRVEPCLVGGIPKTGCYYLVSSRQGRVAGSCVPLYYVDGARFPIEPGVGLGVNDLSIDEVEAIEVYSSPGSVPGQYLGSSSGCGVVLLWTRLGTDG